MQFFVMFIDVQIYTIDVFLDQVLQKYRLWELGGNVIIFIRHNKHVIVVILHGKVILWFDTTSFNVGMMPQ